MEWLKDRVLAQVNNLESPGQDIYVNVNAKSFLIKHGEDVVVPRLVVDVLNETKVIKYKIQGEMGKPNTVKEYLEPRYLAVIKKENVVEDKAEATKKALKKEFAKSKQVKTQEDD